MNSTWMSNIMRGTRVGSGPAQFTEEGLNKLKNANIGGKFGEVVESASVAKVSCWKGCDPKPGTPKTKKSPTRPGERVNNCDCG